MRTFIVLAVSFLVFWVSPAAAITLHDIAEIFLAQNGLFKLNATVEEAHFEMHFNPRILRTWLDILGKPGMPDTHEGFYPNTSRSVDLALKIIIPLLYEDRSLAFDKIDIEAFYDDLNNGRLEPHPLIKFSFTRALSDKTDWSKVDDTALDQIALNAHRSSWILEKIDQEHKTAH